MLLVLEREEAYGLEILERVSGQGGVDLSEGTIYPLLNRLEKEGKVRSRWVPPEGGGHPRKYYALTADGAALLPRMKEVWCEFSSGLDGLLGDAG